MGWLLRLLDRLPSRGTLGQRGERIAARHLRKQRYTILAKNLRLPMGEIDLLAEAPDGRTIVIVEVKSGSGEHSAPLPETHVNAAKERKLTALASHLVRHYGWVDRPVRFDVIGIDISGRGDPRVRHHVGAFESRG